ncbi:uncharacterized protein NECHADRAFT_25379, partial [Fusarium vanettenii 77-13-4]
GRRICQNELERFLLWCQGLDVADGRLDEVLSRSKELHRQVLSLLLRLGTSILQAMSQASVEPSQLQLDDCDHLRALLDVAETMLKGSGLDEHERPDTPLESDESNYGMVESIEEISAYVDCLLDLAPALDNPVLDIQTDDSNEPLSGTKESFTTSCEEALIYCRKIRDRFDPLPRYLVERLAEANVVRAAKIREMQHQVVSKEPPINDTVTESLFTGRLPQITETTKSSVPPPSVFSSALVSRHVFNDLNPYMCTIEHCQMGGTLYKHSRTWALHESAHVTAAFRSVECTFCSATYQRLDDAYYKHVSGHLREVSLSVLPQTIDNDAESGTDDSE